MKTGLVLVDIQNDYFPGGAMELVSMESVAGTASTVLDTFREQKNPVYHIQHVSTRPGATFFMPGGWGVQEGSFILFGGLFGLPADATLALSLVTRAREIAVSLAGLAVWQQIEGRSWRRRLNLEAPIES